MKINIKKLDADAVLPTRGSSQAAGYDLYAKSSEDTVIPPHKTVMVGTGLAMEIPEGYFGAIFARSGLASKQGLRPANCVGVVDSAGDGRSENGRRRCLLCESSDRPCKKIRCRYADH